MRKEWRFLHSYAKRMEISPFFCFPTPFSNVILDFHYHKKENGEFSKKKKRFHLEKHAEKRLFFPISSVKTLLKKKEWRFLHSFEKRMEISPFFCEKNGDFSIFFSDPIQQCYFGFSLPQKREWRSLHSPKQKGVFTFNMLKSLFCSILSVKAFFSQKQGDFSILICGPHSADYPQKYPKNLHSPKIG